MNVLVIGLGGIGSIYSLLLQLGAPDIRLSLVARSNYDALSTDGISIKSAKYGNHTVKPHAVFKTTSEAAVAGINYDYVFCTTKSLPNAPAVDILRPVVSTMTSTIVLIQNGLGIEEPVHAAFPENTLVSCTAYIGVWQVSPGHIEHSALDRLELGTYPDQATVSATRRVRDQESLERISSILSTGGCDTKLVPSMPAARWQKLVWNASFNCVCTITGLNTFEVTRCPAAKEMVLAAMHEIILAANKSGYALPVELVVANWDNTQKMGVAYKPSMMLDHEAGREMEVEVILGSPIRAAQQAGVDVPILKVMKQTLDILNWKTAEMKKGVKD